MSYKFIKSLRWILTSAALLVSAFVTLAIYTNVPTAVSNEDKEVFESLNLKSPQGSMLFEQEIALIQKVQSEVFKRAPLGEGIPYYESREPADLMRFGQGLCFDRSRTLDKAFSYLGLPSRHVYLLYRENKYFLTALLHYGQSSHAVTEVKTSRGWMFVDSNTKWIALTRNSEPVDADNVWKRFDDFEAPPSYLKPPWWAIRGMYSRKGLLYGSWFPFPDINWPDFMSWLLDWA